MIYAFKEAVRGLQRHLTTSLVFIFTLGFALLVFNFFLWGFWNLNQIGKQMKEKIGMEVYLKDDLSFQKTADLRSFLESQPEIQKVEFKTKEDALDEMKVYFGAELLENLSGNPLPNSFSLEIKERFKTSDKILAIAEKIKTQNGVEGVEYGEAWVERLDKLSTVFLKVALIFGIFLTLAILMMVTTTVRLIIITKSETLKLLKVLGAKTSFILKPYFVGGLLLGFSATGLSVLGLYVVHQFFKSKFWTVSFLPLEILGGVILGVLFLSAAGSLFSMTRVLKV